MNTRRHELLKMTALAVACASVLLLMASIGSAQPPPGGGMMGPGPGGPPGQGPGRPRGPGGDGLMEDFFPPEMVMRNQKAIGLTAEQQTAIRTDMQKSMAQFTDLRWQQSAAEEAMGLLVKPEHPDEKQVLAELDKLLKIENEVKRLNLASMIRIKNILTSDQQGKLRELQKQQGPQRQSRQGGPPPQGQGGPQGPNDRRPPPPDGDQN